MCGDRDASWQAPHSNGLESGAYCDMAEAALTRGLGAKSGITRRGRLSGALLDERAAVELVECPLKFCSRVHHNRTIPGDRLFDRLAGDEQEPDSFITGLHRDLVTAVEEGQGPGPDAVRRGL